jgi:hypothetical protein
MGRCDVLITGRTNETLLQLLATFIVDEQRWRAVGASEVKVAPLHQRDKSTRKVPTLWREAVFVADRPILVGNFLQDAVVNKANQSFRQKIAGNAEVLSQRIEPANPPESVAQDEQTPPVANHPKGCGNRAVKLQFRPRRCRCSTHGTHRNRSELQNSTHSSGTNATIEAS